MRRRWKLPHIILVRPQEEGNVGSVARAMANTGLRDLVLVEPASALGATARAFAVGARRILEESRRVASVEEAVGPYRRVVGTTSARARRRDVPPIEPRELPRVLSSDPPGTETALVFGPERSGLTVDELALCNPLVTIPCALEQPTLNLAQAVLILAYELFVAPTEALPKRVAPWEEQVGEIESSETRATSAEIDGLFEHLRAMLTQVGFERDDTFPAVMRNLRRLAAGGGPSGREVQILRGICRRITGRLSRLEAPDPVALSEIQRPTRE